MDLGRVGVFSLQAARLPAAACVEAVQEMEELGYGAIWVPEGGFLKEAFANMGLLLSATRRVPFATAIANIWARAPSAMEHGSKALAEAFPGRFLLGLGVSHVEEVEGRRKLGYEKPVEAMRAYLEAMDSAPYLGVEPAEPAPRVIAALAPRMLGLAGELTLGTHPYFVPPEHAAYAREVMGDGKMIAPGLPVLLETDPRKARTIARDHTSRYLSWRNYRQNLLRLGFAEEDFADGGSDRLVDAVVAWGDLDAIRERVRAHLDAGATHVCVQPLPMSAPQFPLDELRRLAPALLDL